MTPRDKQRKPPVDPERASRILMQVLGLAEALPFRPQAELPYPPLKGRLTEVRQTKISQLHVALVRYLAKRLTQPSILRGVKSR
jgi:chorismate mutase